MGKDILFLQGQQDGEKMVHVLRGFWVEQKTVTAENRTSGSDVESFERADLVWSLGIVERSQPEALCSGVNLNDLQVQLTRPRIWHRIV